MIEMTSFVAIIIGVTQLLKDTGLNSRFSPIISLGLGIAAGIFFLEGDVQYRVLSGILLGLASSGLYDVGKIPTRLGSKLGDKI